jgi:hypothetical protein
MKKSNKRGNLHLTTEAIRTLAHHQLDAVAGGGLVSNPNTCAQNTCYPRGCLQ